MLHCNCRDASSNYRQAQPGIAQWRENSRTTQQGRHPHWVAAGNTGKSEMQVTGNHNIYHYTHEGEWMISSPPAWLLQSWNMIKMSTTMNRTELKRKARVSLRPFLWTHSFKMFKGKRWPFFFLLHHSLVWFWAAWGSYLTQLWELMHFPVLGTLPQTKINWPKKYQFYNTQTKPLLWWTTSKLVQKPQY